jgi:hypothetical protein
MFQAIAMLLRVCCNLCFSHLTEKFRQAGILCCITGGRVNRHYTEQSKGLDNATEFLCGKAIRCFLIIVTNIINRGRKKEVRIMV